MAAADYDHQHRRLRRAALDALTDGDPCARCGLGMDATQTLDLDHTDDRTGYLGLSHSWCNRAKRAAPPTPPTKPLQRACTLCGRIYRANNQRQRFCSRSCSNEWRWPRAGGMSN